jgi:peroxiredoxin
MTCHLAIHVLRAVSIATLCGCAAAQTAPAQAKELPLFVSVPPAAIDHELRFGAVLPQFQTKDIAGRSWRSEDLRGKLTVLYLFHTLQSDAPPVKRDLLLLQRFYEKVKNSEFLQVLTFSSDYDYTHAPEFMARHRYTFPVIADWALLAKLFPKDDCRRPCTARVPTASGQSFSIATAHWVVDPAGRLSYPARSWSLDRLLLEVERLGADRRHPLP